MAQEIERQEIVSPLPPPLATVPARPADYDDDQAETGR
jgi:hypothetical protein